MLFQVPTNENKRNVKNRRLESKSAFSLKTECFIYVELLLLLLHPFDGLFSRTTWVSRYQKGKTSLDLNEARDDGVLGYSGFSWTIMLTVCTSLQTDNHTSTSSLNFCRLDALDSQIYGTTMLQVIRRPI